MNQTIEKTEVQNIVLFKSTYKEVVQKLVLIRKESGCTQKDISEWLQVDKRKTSSFENLEKIDLELLLKYADKMSVELKLTYKIN